MGNRRWVITRMHGDGTETPLHWDAPVFDDEITVQLSGAALMRGSVPVSQLVKAYDGYDTYLPWSTAIYALEGNRVLAGGIITELVTSNGRTSFVAEGWSRYPHEQPHTGSFSIVKGDAAGIYRILWDHIQGRDRGHIGVEVTGLTRSGLLLGEPVIPGYTEAKIGSKWYKLSDPQARGKVEPDLSGALGANMTKTQMFVVIKDPSRGNWGKRSYPFLLRIGGETVRVTGHSSSVGRLILSHRGSNGSRVTKHYKNTTVRADGTVTRKVKAVPPKPWRANWYDTPDIGREMDRLAADGGFEYIEETTLSGDTFSRRIRLGKPLGTRRGGLRFMVGENIVKVPEIVADADRWASEVLALGAGEGSKMVHSTSARTHGRLRRAHVVSDKGARSRTHTQALARRELSYRSGYAGVQELLVRNSQDAPFGSFSPGDEVLIRTDEETASMDMWVRILAITYLSEEDMATLFVSRI